MKIRSIDELEQIIAKEFSWRRKELTNIKNLCLSSKKPIKNTLLKLGISILYSHWEGFIKQSSIAFCEYINGKGISYDKLIHNFHVYAILECFEGQYPHKNFKSALRLVDGISIPLNNKCKIDSKKYIDTKSNLNSEILKEITMKIGVDYSLYELKENLIDERFLGFRNAVSHGEYREINEEDFIGIFDEITALIEIYKNQILNSVIQKSYLKVHTVVG
jgi:MAE_28990/MAE_18760-like HEPN